MKRKKRKATKGPIQGKTSTHTPGKRTRTDTFRRRGKGKEKLPSTGWYIHPRWKTEKEHGKENDAVSKSGPLYTKKKKKKAEARGRTFLFTYWIRVTKWKSSRCSFLKKKPKNQLR